MSLLSLPVATLLSLCAGRSRQAPPKIDFLEVEGSGFADPADVVAPGKIMRYFTRTPAAAAHPGTAFGMTVKTVGQPAGADIVLRWVWKLPKPGIKDDKTGKLTRQVVEEVPTKIGAVVAAQLRIPRQGRHRARQMARRGLQRRAPARRPPLRHQVIQGLYCRRPLNCGTLP